MALSTDHCISVERGPADASVDPPTCSRSLKQHHPTTTENIARRLVSVPLLFVIAIFATAAAPLALFVCVLADAVRSGTPSLPRSRAALFFLALLWCEVAGVLGAFCLWAATVGGRLCGQRRYLDAHYALQRWWSSTIFGAGVVLFSMTVELDGKLPGDRPLLLLVRHSSTADTVLAAAVLANPTGLRLRYVLKRELLWDPCLDIVGQRIPNAFVARRGSKGGDVAAISELGGCLGPGEGVLIYPEGTRFSRDKLERSLARLRARDGESLLEIAETFSRVLPPRLGGVRALLDAAPTARVVFVDHTGFEAATSFREFWRGGLVGTTIRIRLRHADATEIPVEGRERWLFERWQELDRWLAARRLGSGER